MALTDFQKILDEYKVTENDFGFSALSEEDYKARITDAQYEASSLTAREYEQRLLQIEKIIIPFLQKLHSTSDQEYIYWPNRKELLETEIQKILKLTRG
jgi:hypothetical protein